MAEIKYPNVKFSNDAVKEYVLYFVRTFAVGLKKDKDTDRLSKRIEALQKKESPPIKWLNRVFNSTNKTERQIAILETQLSAVEEMSLKEFASEKGLSFKEYVELSAETKLYFFTKMYKKTVKKMIKTEAISSQEEIDFVIQRARENIEKYPLSISHTYETLQEHPNANISSFEPDWAREVLRAQHATHLDSLIKERDKNKIKHSSLTKLFKTGFRENSEILSVISHCDVSRDAGCLPPEWIAIIPKEQIAQKTKEISDLLKKFAISTCSYAEIDKSLLLPHISDLEQKLSESLKQNVQIDFLGRGNVGKTYKIQTGEKALVLKTNHVESHLLSDLSSHGVSNETAKGIYASNSCEKKNFVKTYMGRIGSVYDRDTFILTRFIEKDNHHKEPITTDDNLEKLSASKICTVDAHEENIINGKVIDMGATELSTDFEDREFHNFVKKIIEALPHKDGVQIFEQLKHRAAKSPALENKLNKALKYVDKRLKKEMPDIDHYGIHKRLLRDDVMEAMGITNKIPLGDALWLTLNDAPDSPMLQYIIKTMGGTASIRKHISENSDMCIPPFFARLLIDNGLKAKDFANSKYLDADELEKYEANIDRKTIKPVEISNYFINRIKNKERA